MTIVVATNVYRTFSLNNCCGKTRHTAVLCRWIRKNWRMQRWWMKQARTLLEEVKGPSTNTYGSFNLCHSESAFYNSHTWTKRPRIRYILAPLPPMHHYCLTPFIGRNKTGKTPNWKSKSGLSAMLLERRVRNFCQPNWTLQQQEPKGTGTFCKVPHMESWWQIMSWKWE